ncbi:hypothetical protein BKA65DRAFT_235222 [Rhexocercosporidium sp. MPI-PUGE-AT-0058]|nr:hypothetical protein BKA65DRAFT_235222 [Rhexocercosporidium sp. MPI-PUGE-AT-0058]
MSVLARSSLKYLHQREGNTSQPQTQPPTPKQQQTFTFFTKLPVEIRFKIWKLLAPEPRTIDVGTTQHNNRFPGGERGGNLLCRLHTTAIRQVPRILHVNHEARSLTLESYSLEFGIRLSKSPVESYLPFAGRIYVNWERDIICPIGVDDFKAHWMAEILEHSRITNIALNVRELLNPVKELRSDGCLNIHSLFGMPRLEEVIFYYSDPSPQRGNIGNVARGLRLEFEDLNESLIVKDLCRMPLSERPSLSYLLAARKTVNKDYDVLIEKRKARDKLVRKWEKAPGEFEIKGIDRILEKKRPVVRLAYLIEGGSSSSPG